MRYTQLCKQVCYARYDSVDFLDCLSTFKTTPIALIKTSKLVEPAEMNGSGNPVGGMLPVNTSYYIIKLKFDFCTKIFKTIRNMNKLHITSFY